MALINDLKYETNTRNCFETMTTSQGLVANQRWSMKYNFTVIF